MHKDPSHMSTADLPELEQEQKSEWTQEDVRKAILHCLNNYPILSHSMLTVAMRSQAYLWRPILQQLIDEGSVLEKQRIINSVSNRSLCIKSLMLKENESLYIKLSEQV